MGRCTVLRVGHGSALRAARCLITEVCSESWGDTVKGLAVKLPCLSGAEQGGG